MKKTDYTLISAELSRIAREQIIRTRNHIVAHLHATHRVLLTKKIMAELEKAMHSWKGNLWRFTRQYECWIGEIMARELQEISAG